MKKYINKQTREDIVLLMHIQAVMESIIEKWGEFSSTPFKLRWLRSSNTILRRFLVKSVKESADTKDMKRAVDYFKRSKLLLKTEASASLYLKRWEEEYETEKVEVPIKYLDELVTVAMNGNCVGCQGVKGCYAKEIFEAYDVPSNAERPKKCKYEIKKG